MALAENVLTDVEATLKAALEARVGLAGQGVPVRVVTPDPDFIELELPCLTLQLADVGRDPARKDNDRRVEKDVEAMEATVRPPTEPYDLHFAVGVHAEATRDERLMLEQVLCLLAEQPALTTAVHLSVDVADGTEDPATEFRLVVKEDGEAVETWDDLSLDPEAGNYVETVINGQSAYVQVTDLESATPAPDDRPAVQADAALAGGADGASDITDSDYVGSPADRTGLHALDTIDEINNLCVPGISSQTVVQAALDYVDGRGDCGVIVDSPEGADPAAAKAFRELFDSSRGYCYFPRIKALDPLTKRVKVIPPSGHIAGVFARSDGERGVHKAPSNEVMRGAVGLEYEVTDGEQEILNPAGVNCIRAFRGRGIRVWGARTMSSDASLLHIHKRRFLMFVEESIAESTQWIVHEPSDQRLWGKIIRSVSAFLRRQWLEGALFGASEAEAYYVKCDEETNPPEVRAAFQVITEVGLNIVETAEFVVFRVAQWSGGRRITE